MLECNLIAAMAEASSQQMVSCVAFSQPHLDVQKMLPIFAAQQMHKLDQRTDSRDENPSISLSLSILEKNQFQSSNQYSSRFNCFKRRNRSPQVSKFQIAKSCIPYFGILTNNKIRYGKATHKKKANRQEDNQQRRCCCWIIKSN